MILSVAAKESNLIQQGIDSSWRWSISSRPCNWMTINQELLVVDKWLAILIFVMPDPVSISLKMPGSGVV
jgi:hypothetical protein